jgi:hypothetical protein
MAPSGARWHQAQERQNARNERRARSSDALQRRLVDEWSPAWLRSHSEPLRDWGRVDVPDSPPGGNSVHNVLDAAFHARLGVRVETVVNHVRDLTLNASLRRRSPAVARSDGRAAR